MAAWIEQVAAVRPLSIFSRFAVWRNGRRRARSHACTDCTLVAGALSREASIAIFDVGADGALSPSTSPPPHAAAADPAAGLPWGSVNRPVATITDEERLVLSDALRTGTPHAAVLAGQNPEGRRCWTELHAIPLADGKGMAPRLLVIRRDVTADRQTQRALAESRKHLSMAEDIAQLGYWVWDFVTDELVLSEEALRIFGDDARTAPSSLATLFDRVHEDDRKSLSDAFFEVSSSSSFDLQCRICHVNGGGRTVRLQGQVFTADGRERPRLHGIIHDISDRRWTDERLRMLSLAVEQGPASVIITDVRGRVEYVNRKFTDVTGFAPEEILGEPISKLGSGRMPRIVFAEMWKTLLSGREWRGEIFNKRKNGELFWELVSISPIRDDAGRVTSFLAIQEDISIRKAYEERLLRQANFDELTGLPNRTLALDRLASALARARRNGTIVALLMIDLDHFKTVNDTLGHAAGDVLLQQTARRLEAYTRRSDTVARLGGDEFAIVLADMPTAKNAESAVQKVHDLFHFPFVLEGTEAFVTASVGIALFPNDGDEPGVLLKNADAAMYRSKQRGRNDYSFFSHDINEEAHQRLTIVTHMRGALERCEFSLHYQPIVEAKSGRMVAVEALLRWQSPELGGVPPDRFIPLAEESGLIVPLGEWVLHTACAQLAAWRGVLPVRPRLAVNVSARQFRDERLVAMIAEALTRHGLNGETLELEITESLLLQDLPATDSVLEMLRGMGVRLSIDDFGTGYSSLSYLKRFRVQTLKIDRSFINDVTVDADDATLVTAIVAMAHRLGLSVVAEGVETGEQRAFLQSLECDLLQGYYFCRPVPADALARYADPAHADVAAAQ